MNKMSPKTVSKESELIVPMDLRKALAAAPAAEAVWRDLTPLARWDFIHWVDTAKQSETRNRRIERTCEMLPAGKRRPCCYSIVPMELYKALAANPMAKVQWGSLTPIERRNFISFIDIAKQRDEHSLRIEKVCKMLAAGKQHPSK
jgi:uncharacterized protein YdeI (YjbR/CyaY-like superfamily)